MAKIDRKSDAYSDLKRKVLALTLAPGEALDEVAIAAAYGLSRTPLRDVYQRLAGEGYIEIQANKGASVSSMDLATMRNFFQSAPMIYAAIARLAAEQATAEQITGLKKIQLSFERAVKRSDASNMSIYNHQFHEHVGDMAHSPYLKPSLCRLLIDHTRMSHRFYRVSGEESRTRINQSSDQHAQMIEAIEKHEPARCVELTVEHWELSRSDLHKYGLPDALPLDNVMEN